MEKRWSLEKLFPAIDSDEFKNTRKEFSAKLESLSGWEPAEDKSNQEIAEEFIENMQEFYRLMTLLMAYLQLKVSVDARNQQALKLIDELEKEAVKITAPRVKFMLWLKEIISDEKTVSGFVAGSDLLEEHQFVLEELLEESQYLLSENEEVLVAEMKRTGSSAWTKLQQKLTSTLMVDIELDGEEQELPLSVVRNLYFKADPEVRKTAYEAELAAYDKIDESVAAALNGIKGEVLTVTEKRGFDEPLDETLVNSRMDKETLDAMLEAMKNNLSAFHDFYNAKAKVLGHDRGLPFYDIFAPLGEVEMEFSYEEAKDFIIDNIREFSDEMADLYEEAFNNNWIDAEPRDGKRGGAFCYNINPIEESRILSNFTGSFSDMTTLAHELGHAYHGYCLSGESILNTDYPMPLAETASIFSETIVTNAALKEADQDEQFVILENSISGAGQVIVDIYSRFLFESRLFEARKNASLSVDDLKELMVEAQKDAYGDSLDHDYLHPSMWINKSHYYSAGNNYYNFPYAFGLLFGLGVYALYLKDEDDFLDKYNELLRATGQKKALDVAEMVGIDLHDPEFWEGSLEVIKQDIDRFLELAEDQY
ncbi:M3 family oligoendopeptidase [Halanaerobiaceae bacterium Z-7014]|uniref:M3 family oligoendopeptidase n=1 Tax=Halonatronomonas betaini TaxID=2778430 RepID=A0A931AUT1_9FIRM|nr:M3 family oligoendopeptidase [Halonatronomonas betaini]MBF8437064.1 M3 family oligoendopeptidase [Halonatronomonas betaini]